MQTAEAFGHVMVLTLAGALCLAGGWWMLAAVAALVVWAVI